MPAIALRLVGALIARKGWLWLPLLLALGMPAAAGNELVLNDRQTQFDAWDALTIRSDPTHQLTLTELRRDPASFQPHTGPRANLGPRDDTVWLRLPLRLDGDARQWIFDVDYASIQHIELFLLDQGTLVAHRQLGAAQPMASRPIPSRSHAMALTLKPGQHYELYLRIRTPSTMVLPITLIQPDAFQVREYSALFSQGLIAGIALALLFYGLLHRWSLKDPLFVYYALMLSGSTAYFLSFFGIAQQLLWDEQTALTLKMGPLCVLVALTGGGQFVAQALETRTRYPRLHVGLIAVSSISLIALVASLLNLIDYRATQALATAMGPGIMIFAVPAAWLRARQGDRIGIYMLAGWSCYMIGAVATAGLLRGYAPASWWTLHLLQLGWLIEMLAWMRVLGLNIESLRSSAQQAELEKQSLESLAHTDSLTGLPNRRALEAAITHALTARNSRQLVAIYLLDLDGFKAVNDRFGHDVGDHLLVQVGQRLRQQLRQSDFLARYGGDEFVVVSAMPGLAEAAILGQKLIDSFTSPFAVDNHECRVGLTVGYTLAPQDGNDTDTLLKHADRAMYAGKQDGRHVLRHYGEIPTP